MCNPQQETGFLLKRDSYNISCKIRFLSEAIPAWVTDDCQPSADAACGLEAILADIATQARLLETANFDNHAS